MEQKKKRGEDTNILKRTGQAGSIILEITPPIIKIDRGTKLFEKICSAINFLL